MLDQSPEQDNDLSGLLPTCLTEIDPVVVELAKRSQGLGVVRLHTDASGLLGGSNH